MVNRLPLPANYWNTKLPYPGMQFAEVQRKIVKATGLSGRDLDA
jgi:hypothetical protein